MQVLSSINREERLVASLLAFGELMKPELTGLSVLTALFGYWLASGGNEGMSGYLFLALSTLLVGGGAGALNQWIEKDFDFMMKRTERRPLPSGRVQSRHAFVFGLGLTVLGNLLLALIFGLLTGLLGVLTSSLYLLVYTPLKRKTWHNTTVGAVPGALPVLIGWTAGNESLPASAWLLFALLFLWQYPHFLSLAWLYRKDYARAGFQMLSVVDVDDSRRTSLLNLGLSACLISVCWGLGISEGFGISFVVGAAISNALLTGTAYLALRASRRQPLDMPVINRATRQLFFASLLYLPVLMGGALFDSLP